VERKRRVQVGPDVWVDATEVGFRAAGENWNEYLADDGSVIRVKLVVTEILRVDDQYDQDGNPAYLVRSTNVTSVSAPDDLRKRNER
jgi:hypothetical protein